MIDRFVVEMEESTSELVSTITDMRTAPPPAAPGYAESSSQPGGPSPPGFPAVQSGALPHLERRAGCGHPVSPRPRRPHPRHPHRRASARISPRPPPVWFGSDATAVFVAY
jgi:hypothetical protein